MMKKCVTLHNSLFQWESSQGSCGISQNSQIYKAVIMRYGVTHQYNINGRQDCQSH